jgi:hypothetical protein
MISVVSFNAEVQYLRVYIRHQYTLHLKKNTNSKYFPIMLYEPFFPANCIVSVFQNDHPGEELFFLKCVILGVKKTKILC